MTVENNTASIASALDLDVLQALVGAAYEAAAAFIDAVANAAGSQAKALEGLGPHSDPPLTVDATEEVMKRAEAIRKIEGGYRTHALAIRALAKSDPFALTALERVKMQARREELDRILAVWRDVAGEALLDEVPEGYGPDGDIGDADFHRGYDAALGRVRAAIRALAEGEG